MALVATKLNKAVNNQSKHMELLEFESKKLFNFDSRPLKNKTLMFILFYLFIFNKKLNNFQIFNIH